LTITFISSHYEEQKEKQAVFGVF